MVIHSDENRLTRNIFPFSINVKEVYSLFIPNAGNQTHLSTKYTKWHERKPFLPFFMLLRVLVRGPRKVLIVKRPHHRDVTDEKDTKMPRRHGASGA